MGISASAQGDKPGHIKAVGFAAVEAGYLACDGAAVSRATYAALFTAIGVSWGAGDGSTTFNTPDLKGRAMIGSGAGSGLTARTLAGSGGEESHVLTAAEMPVHSHGVPVNTAGTSSVNVAQGENTLAGTPLTNTAGSGGAHNVMQPYKVVMFQIKY